MYLPKKLSSIEDTCLIGYWHEDKVPVYEVTNCTRSQSNSWICQTHQC